MSEVFKAAVSSMAKKQAILTTGTVKQVTGNTCTVNRQNLPDLLDVRLNAIDANLTNKILVKPAVGSKVLCIEIDGSREETAILKYSEIESVLVEVDGAILEVKQGKLSLKNNHANLEALLTELYDELAKAIIKTPAGPGTFSPNNVTKFKELKQKTKKLLQ